MTARPDWEAKAEVAVSRVHGIPECCCQRCQDRREGALIGIRMGLEAAAKCADECRDLTPSERYIAICALLPEEKP